MCDNHSVEIWNCDKDGRKYYSVHQYTNTSEFGIESIWNTCLNGQWSQTSLNKKVIFWEIDIHILFVSEWYGQTCNLIQILVIWYLRYTEYIFTNQYISFYYFTLQYTTNTQYVSFFCAFWNGAHNWE